MSKFVKMVGMALDGSGVMKELEVLPANVEAFKRSGYTLGSLPKKEWSNDLGTVSYTLSDSIAQMDKTETTKPIVKRRARGRR